MKISTPNLVVACATAISLAAMYISPERGIDVAKTIGVGLIGFLSSEAIHRKEDDKND